MKSPLPQRKWSSYPPEMRGRRERSGQDSLADLHVGEPGAAA